MTEKHVNSRISPTCVELHVEYFLEKMSSTGRSIINWASAYENISRTYERRSRRGNKISSATYQEYAVKPEFSTYSPSYEIFTTYENISWKEVHQYINIYIFKILYAFIICLYVWTCLPFRNLDPRNFLDFGFTKSRVHSVNSLFNIWVHIEIVWT